jgi:hypothetical protein
VFNRALTEFITHAKKFIARSYTRPYCLYFPAPIITAACLLLADRAFITRPFEIYPSGSNYLSITLRKLSFLGSLSTLVAQDSQTWIIKDPRYISLDISEQVTDASDWLDAIMPAKRLKGGERIAIIDVIQLASTMMTDIPELI